MPPPSNRRSGNPSRGSTSARQTQTKSGFLKEHYGGSRPLFQQIHGLKMTPEDLREGDEIIRAMMEMDAEEAKEAALERKRRATQDFLNEFYDGSRHNFQRVYGLKMTPEDLREGDAIIQKMMEMDAQETYSGEGNSAEEYVVMTGGVTVDTDQGRGSRY